MSDDPQFSGCRAIPSAVIGQGRDHHAGVEAGRGRNDRAIGGENDQIEIAERCDHDPAPRLTGLL